MIGLTALVALLLTMPSLFTILVMVAVFALLTRYNLLVIQSLAHGQLRAPSLGEAMDGNSAVLLLKVIGMIVVAGGAATLIAPLGEGALQLYSILLSLLSPAAMIVLALEGRLRAAINPIKLLHFMLVIGWPYLLLWVASSAVSTAPTLLVGITATKLPLWAVFMLGAAAVSYFYIVTSAMMGYLCLTRQQALGIIPDTDARQEPLDERAFERARALAQSHVLSCEAEFDSARKVLVEALRRDSEDVELNERYYRLLLAAQDSKALRELAPYLLEKFVRMDRAYKAAELYLITEPTPVIDKSFLRHQIADALYRQQRYQPAAKLLTNLHKEDRDYRELDAAYLLLANIFVDGFNRTDLASQLVAFLRKHFPQSTHNADIVNLQKVLATS